MYPSKFVPRVLRSLSRQRFPWLGAALVMRLPSQLTSCLDKANYRGLELYLYTGEEMGRRIYFFNRFEPRQEEAFASLVAPSSVVFDVGANMGIYSLLAARKGARCYAFEPSTRARRLLERNIVQNGFSERITALPIAVSGSDGEVNFYEGRSGNWGVGKIFSFAGTTQRDESYVVQSFTLDTLARRFGVPDIVKMDIEGAEHFALQGCDELLRSEDCPYFLVELHTQEVKYLGGDVNDLLDRFANAGLRRYMLGGVQQGKHQWYLFGKQPPQNNNFVLCA